MFDNRDTIDFAHTKIPALFRSLFIPTLLGMLFNMAFLLTDGIFIGHGVGPEGLAVVNLVAPIMMVATGLGMMLGIGGSVVSAIHLSKENVKAARIIVTQAFWAALAVSVLLGLVYFLFPSTVLSLLGVSKKLMPLALEYYLWFIPTTLLLMFQIVGEFVIRLDGSPRFAMYSNVIPALVNIGFDYLFIIVFDWDLRGAALATDIGTFVGAAMTFYYMTFKPQTLSFYRLKRTRTSLRLSLRNVGYMTRTGFSAFVGEFAISVMMLTGNRAFGSHLGDEGIAAFGVICYLFPLVFMIYNAAAQSAQPIISFNYGAGNRSRVLQTFRHSLAISLAFGLFMTLLFVLFAPTVVAIFLAPDTASFRLAAVGLPLFATGYVFVSFNISAIGYFQSVEQSTFATLLMLCRGVVFLVAAFLLLPPLLGTAGLWLAVPCAEMLTVAAAGLWLLLRKSHSIQ